MSTNASSSTKLCNSGAPSHSPKSRIAQTDNDIRVSPNNLITKPVKLMLELLSDVFGFSKYGVPQNGFSLPATEVEKVIPGWVLLEDVGPVEFRVKVPYGR